jgi:predicted metal-dependent enzyme (double-stranded beta helix superfamily)
MRPVVDPVATLGELFEAHGPVDWDDPRAARELAGALFDEVTSRERMLLELVQSISLAADGTGESFPALDKLVLWQSPDREVRLRLHVFYPGYSDRPHNHRWSFVSRLLGGEYVHSIYGFEGGVLEDASGGREPRAVYNARLPTGADYYLHHSIVHSLHTDAVTVSLLLRGPSTKDAYFTVEGSGEAADRSERVRWSTGAARESEAERDSKAMSEEGLARVARVLREVVEP